MKVRGLYQKRGWYYYQPPQKGGVKVSAVALKTRDLAEAIKLMDQAKVSAALESSPERMSAALDRYLREKKAEGMAARSLTTSRNVLKALAGQWGNPLLGDVSEKMVKQWRDQLAASKGYAGKKKSDTTVNSYVQRLRGFLTWAVDSRLISNHPMSRIKSPRPKATRSEKFLTLEQREILLEHAENENVELILYLGLFAGMRFIEMTAMRPEWIRMTGNGTAVISVQEDDWFKPKDKEKRDIPIPSRLADYLKNYGMREPYLLAPDKEFDLSKPAGYRFNPKKSFVTHATACGFPWLRYHLLRHTYITMHAMRGTSIAQLAKWTGTDVVTLQNNYFGFYPAQDDVEGIC